MPEKILEWEIINAYACPYCGALVRIEEAEETCWSCDRRVEFPG